MKTIFILLDTLRRDFLEVYDKNTDVKTPNITKLAQDSCIFTNHYTGSLPCMPARRDLFTGRLDFFDREWGSVEPYDILFTRELNKNNVKTHLITDHYHYWEIGGEGFYQSFKTYNLHRGQVNDLYEHDNLQLDLSKYHGVLCEQYQYNRTNFKEANDFPTTKCFVDACDYIEKHYDDDNFFLQVEGFDPHQPFDAPKEFLEMYDVDLLIDGKIYDTPQDGPVNEPEKYIDFITRKYKANTSFADYGIGLLLDKLKEKGIYDECTIVFTTDHGYTLNDHGYYGKGHSHPHNEISKIPLIVKTSGQNQSKTINAFTQNIDLAPTFCELHNTQFNENIHGKSIMPLINGEVKSIKESILSGFHGKSVLYVDEEYTYLRGPKNRDNHPCYEYKCVPVTFHGFFGSPYSFAKIEDYNKIETGRFLNHTSYPQYRFQKSKPNVDFPKIDSFIDNELYLTTDIKQKENIISEKLEIELNKRLVKEMKALDVIDEQYERLGLTK